MPATMEPIPFKPILRPADFPSDARVRCAEVVLADDLDDALIRFHQKNAPGTRMLVDLSQATYVELAVLLNIIALLLDRKERGCQTYLTYPRNKRVHDFLAVWRFPEAVEGATKVPLSDFLVHEDRRLLHEPQNTYTGIGSALDALEYDPDWNEAAGSAGYRNFFEFITFSQTTAEGIAPKGAFSAIPRQQSKRWTGPLVEQVLRKHLSGDSSKDDVARVIIYEAISNAVRHPNAHTIQVVSKFARKNSSVPQATSNDPNDDPHGATRTAGTLQVCIWEDGDSIASTLLRVLRDGKPVRAFKLPPYMCERIFVQIRRADNPSQAKEMVVDESDELGADATEPRALLASFFPGVSRAVVVPVPRVDAFDESDAVLEQRPLVDAPGMGLYALRRTVLDQFQGQIVIRSGNYRLLMAIAHDKWRVQKNARYKCKITQYPDHFPEFRGNLVSIQLPIKTV